MACAVGFFDTVAVGAMQHSEDLDATMKECYRVLKPGGHFIISDYALTNSLTQDEYAMLINKPISEYEADKYIDSGSLEHVRTNKSISEHARPLFVYQAAVFNAGFNVLTTVFDATTENGGCLSRILRYIRTAYTSKKFYVHESAIREHGYDHFGNVKAFAMSDEIHYPIYARDKPSLLSLLFLGNKVGKPVYDNIVMILKKPDISHLTLPFRYRSGKAFALPVSDVD